MSKKKEKRPRKDPETVGLRQQTFCTLRESGLSLRKAGELSGYSPGSISYLSRHLEAKRKKGLLAGLVPLAKRAIKATLKGEQVGNAETPKASDVLRAAEMVMDREEPKTQRIEQRSLSAHLSLSSEDRACYLASLQQELTTNGQNINSLLPGMEDKE